MLSKQKKASALVSISSKSNSFHHRAILAFLIIHQDRQDITIIELRKTIEEDSCLRNIRIIEFRNILNVVGLVELDF